VDTTGRTEYGGDGLADSNVVPFPRDWIGPPEDLIPFGSAADDDLAEDLPPTADDFWGEGSALVQDAVQTNLDAGGSPEPTRRRTRRPRVAWRPVKPGRWVSAAGFVAVAAVVLIAVLASSGGKPGTAASTANPSSGRSTSSSSAGVSTVLAAGAQALARVLSAHHGAAVSHRIRHHTDHRDKTVHRPSLRRHGRAHSNGSTVVQIRYPVSSAQSSSIGQAPSVASAPSTPATSGATPSYSSQPKSSTSQPATGPNGSLGPGTSPDS
jgi:hypothetical protein